MQFTSTIKQRRKALNIYIDRLIAGFDSGGRLNNHLKRKGARTVCLILSALRDQSHVDEVQ